MQNKVNQLNDLTAQKDTAAANQTTLDDVVAAAQAKVDAISVNGKNIFVNFTEVLDSLDWANKLNQTNGRELLATDLQNLVESKFTDFVGRYTTQQYQDMINGYINYTQNKTYSTEQIKNLLLQVVNNGINTYIQDFGATLLNLNEISSSDFISNVVHNTDTYYYGSYGNGVDKFPKNYVEMTYLLAFSNLELKKQSQFEYINKDNASSMFVPRDFSGVITQTLGKITAENYINFRLKGSDSSALNIFANKTLYEPVLFLQNDFSSSNISTFLKYKDQLSQVQNAINLVDWNDTNAAWDLTALRAKYDKALERATVVNDLYQIAVEYDTAMKSSTATTQEKDEILSRYYAKKEQLDSLQDTSMLNLTITEKGYEYISLGLDEANKQLKKIKEIGLSYKETDQIVVDTKAEAAKLQQELDTAKAAQKANQATIDNLTNQINGLALTEEEKALDAKKQDLQNQLDQARNNDTTLAQTIADKEAELAKIQEQLKAVSLADKGLRSQAYGTDAFASGNDSIAMGTNATVTANDGIAIGTNATVTGTDSIVLGKGSTVIGQKSIAVGVGHKVTGDRSTTIGDPNIISGNDVFVAGNNNTVASNSVMVLGNNISVATGFDGAVVLGADSTVSAANPVTTMTVQGEAKNVAGTTPTSTVSVGAAGKERQITNVAAGRVSSESTDAVNGSQLNTVVEALNSLQTLDLSTISTTVKNDGVTFATANGNTDAQGLGDTLTVSGDKNITVSGAGDTLTVALNDAVTLDTSLTVGGIKVTTDGINAGSKVISNVADGAISADSKDAVNGSQLNTVKETADTAKSTADGAATLAQTAKDTADTAKATADTAKDTADTAKSTADTAKDTADNAKTVADDAKSTADTAKATADTAKATADTAKSTADEAKNVADTAKTTAENANTVAVEAKNTADVAKATADTAKASAEEAKVLATSASTVAGEAKTTADVAKAAADTAQATATEANVKAEQAQTTANDAKAVAAEANTKAEQAQTVSTEAKAIATDAKNTANDAKVSATEAKGLAQTAQTTANEAKQAAETAQQTADTAQTTATQAQADATTAKADAAEAKTDAATAKTDATTALNKANAVEAKADTALAQSASAEAKATNAETVATNAETKATNAETLANAAKALADKGLNVSDGTTTVNKALGDTVVIKGDDNVKSTLDAQGNFVVSLAENIALNTVTATKVITNNGEISATSKEAVNGSQLHATNTQVESNTKAINSGVVTSTDDGVSTKHKLGDGIVITGDSKNISTVTTGTGAISVKLSDNLSVKSISTDTVKVGDVAVTKSGINAGNTVISNVANGEISASSRDAVNGSQVYELGQSLSRDIANVDRKVDNLDRRVHKLDKKRKAGTASALAVASLPQPHREGQSGFTAAVGQYQSQTGLAVGYSKVADNGRWSARVAVTTNTQKEVGGSVGVGYFW